jgi:hypothetical protein
VSGMYICMYCTRAKQALELIKMFGFQYLLPDFRFKIKLICLIIAAIAINVCQPKKCDQTPLHATMAEPSENRGSFKMIIETKMQNYSYLPDQTYVGMVLIVCHFCFGRGEFFYRSRR